MNKVILRPERMRRFPARFGWLDHRLLHLPDEGLAKLGHSALALYAILALVSDVQGMSYYSNKRLCWLLGCNESTLRSARAQLIKADLLAFSAPLYQLLALRQPEADTAEDYASAEEFEKTLKEAGLL